MLLSSYADPTPPRPLAASRATILAALPRLGRTALLRHVLHHECWEVLEVYGIAACIAQGEQCLPDLIVIDGADSLLFAADLLYAIRAHEILGQSGVIVLGAGADELGALEAGADDFITMPPHRQTFLLRAEAIIRRTRLTKRFLRYADVTMDVEHHRVFRGGSQVDLNPVHYRLLRHFLENPEQVFSHEQLGGVVWSDGASYRTMRSIYTYVYVLRGQLNQGGRPDLIRTEKGGYRLKGSRDTLLKTETM